MRRSHCIVHSSARTEKGSWLRHASRPLRRAVARALGDDSRGRRSTQKVNFVLLGASILIVLATAVGSWQLRTWQLRRIAGRFLRTAEAAIEADDWRRADRNLRQYLTLKPDDPAALRQIALVNENLLSEPADVNRAIHLYALAVGASPDAKGLLLRMGSLQLDLAPEESLNTARRLLAAHPTDPAVHKLHAQSLDQLWTRDESGQISATQVLDAYDDWFHAEPGDIAVLGRLAWLCATHDQRLARETGRSSLDVHQMARQFADRMVEHFSDDPAAFLARYAVRRRLAITGGERLSVSEVDSDVARALQLAPRDAEANLAAAQNVCPQAFDRPIGEAWSQVNDRDRLKRCQTCLTTAQQVAPADERAYLALAELGCLGGDMAGAWRVLQLSLKQVAQPSPGLHLRIGELAVALQQWEHASRAFDAADKSVRQMAARSQDAAATLHRHDFFATRELLQARLLTAANNPERNVGAANELLRSAATRPVSQELRERIRRESARQRESR